MPLKKHASPEASRLQRPTHRLETRRAPGQACNTSVEGMSLTFQEVDDVDGNDSLSLGMLCVGGSITDNVLKEDLQNSTAASW